MNSARKNFAPLSKTTVTTKTKDYFDDDDDEDDKNASFSSFGSTVSTDELDPLDAFMANNDQQIKTEEKNIGASAPLPEIVSEQDRDYEGYYKYCAETLNDVRIVPNIYRLLQRLILG